MPEDEDPLATAGQSELLTALADPDYATRVRAACAIGDQLRFGKLELTATLHDKLVPLLRAEDKSSEWDDLRFEAAIALAEARDPSAEILGEALGESRRRFDALKALSRLAPTPALREAVEHIFKRWLLFWPDRLAAAAVLTVWGDSEATAHFESTLAGAKAERRALAIHLLGDLRMPQAFERLSAIAHDEKDKARGAAVRALGHLFDPRARALIAPFAADETVAEDVTYALELLGP